MTDAKTPTPQINVRAPEDARKTLQRLGGLLRDNADFLATLEAFLDEYDRSANKPNISDRLAQIEARLAALEGEK
ncbi:hypothetical protein [Falsirhodobacter sp. alg1]|uniref:hypothetical protein n=1 Tax=Falsirhodobacter sp. alg1 TaxID=1472418 RepID=UPI0005EFDFEE|nr:hypothetical protein [Falsirhodobacter sp. alg1]